jgi:hypothetical protein
MKTITINGASYSLVTMPASPGPADIEIGWNDLVALQMSPYTLQQQTQQWPGGDWWDAKVTLPSMATATAAPWEAFLAELRGPLNVFQLSDPRHQKPMGNTGASTPKIDSGTYATTTSTLGTVGWQPDQARVLLRGDRFQLGYRLHMVVDSDVSSNSSGAATISIWPSLREPPTAGEPLVLKCPKGLFRLAPAGSRRMLSASPRQLTRIGSFPCLEVR